MTGLVGWLELGLWVLEVVEATPLVDGMESKDVVKARGSSIGILVEEVLVGFWSWNVDSG